MSSCDCPTCTTRRTQSQGRATRALNLGKIPSELEVVVWRATTLAMIRTREGVPAEELN
jgi:hypothetical protein